MKIFGKLFGDKNDGIESLIEKARKQVNKHPTGHLSRPYRAMLMQQIADPTTINKIFFECAKKVFPIWEAEFEGVTPVYEILCKADDFLYRSKEERSYFLKLADKHRNYIEGQNGNVGAAALSSLLLSYAIYCNAGTILNLEDYNGKDDDNAFDWDTAWTPDFCASLAISNGSPFLKDGSNTQKRKEFWLWFLDTVGTLYQSSDKPLLTLKEIEENFSEEKQQARIQTHKTESIKNEIDDIVDRTIEILERENADWNECLLCSKNMAGGNSYKSFIFKNNQKSEFPKKHYEIVSVFSKIKYEMYEQNKIEGAWFYAYLRFGKDKIWDIKFNYDNKPDDFAPEDYQYEFEKNPRAKEFTPEWWRKALGKKAKYLK